MACDTNDLINVSNLEVSSHGQGVLSTLPLEDVSRLAPCTQEEADTRMILYVADAVKPGFVRILVRSVDTDDDTDTDVPVQKLKTREHPPTGSIWHWHQSALRYGS